MRDISEIFSTIYGQEIQTVKNGQSFSAITNDALALLSYVIGIKHKKRVVFVDGKIASKKIEIGNTFNAKVLDSLAFNRVDRVWNETEYSVLGDSFVFWERGYKFPIRVSLFDNEIEEISAVDRDTRLKKHDLTSIDILKQSDVDRIVVGGNLEPNLSNMFLSNSKGISSDDFNIKSLPNIYGLSMEVTGRKIIDGYRKQGYKIYLVKQSEEGGINSQESFDDLIEDSQNLLGGSVLLPDKKFIFITSSDLNGVVSFSKRTTKEDIFKTATIGDFLVHVDHGIGIFNGIVNQDGNYYVELRYAGRDRLLIPFEQGEKLSKFVGAGKKEATLTGLNSGSWKRIKGKAKESAKRIAKELLQIYAVRNQLRTDKVISSKEDVSAVFQFSDTFKYQDTEDQRIITQQMVSDLSKNTPMDRLIVGDVGFGKTELAVRATFAVLNSGKQVALLAPTTVLVEQHVKVFKERLSQYGFNLESLSRLTERKDRERIIDGLEKGTVDLVIGTHFLLNKSLKYKDLGLLIVDEEQRFGVLQKDRLKEKRIGMHVLSMSATPIPRTLNLALLGIRDMSILGSVPEGRRPIKNWMGEYSEGVIAAGIKTELERNGQVYYVHNRVMDLNRVKRELEVLVEGLKVGVAHGQMNRKELGSEMSKFINREYDLLLSTTIIENGLDLPNVNTLIVDDAQKYGLAQLYQIRGRIGRSDRQAYAYFMYDNLRGDAQLRLDAVSESQELGSGYLISNRDLEIRGAGNILGRDQSGTINSVGYSMYIDLLEQAVSQLKKESLLGG